jgi:hypothetical protein
MRKQTLDNGKYKTNILHFKNEIMIASIEGPIHTIDSYVAFPISYTKLILDTAMEVQLSYLECLPKICSIAVF